MNRIETQRERKIVKLRYFLAVIVTRKVTCSTVNVLGNCYDLVRDIVTYKNS